MTYLNMDMGSLIEELSYGSDLDINVDLLSDRVLKGFRKLITYVSLFSDDEVKLSYLSFNEFLFPDYAVKKIKKDDKMVIDLFENSLSFHKWIIDRDSVETKLFRLLLGRVQKGCNFSNGYFRPSLYRTKITDNLKVKINEAEIIIDDVIDTRDYKVETLLSLNKKYLKRYFEERFSFYNRPLEELMFDEYFSGRNKDDLEKKKRSILAERNSFLEMRLRLANYLKSKSKRLEVNYTESDSGRLYSFLSNLNKNIRNEILNDYTEYDLENACVSFFYNVFNEINEEKEISLKRIKHYIDNKDEFREELANTISLEDKHTPDDLNDSKAILTSLFFGSKYKKMKHYDDDTNFGAIDDILGTKERKKKFYNTPAMKVFSDEVTFMMNVINDYLRKNYYDLKSKTLTVNGRSFTFEKRYKRASALAFFYQSWESNFLRGMIKVVRKEQNNRNKDYFLLHDCIYLKEEIDTKLLMSAKQSGDFIVEVNI